MAQPCPIHKVDLVDGVAIQITGSFLRTGALVQLWRQAYRLANPAKFKPRGENGCLRQTKYCPVCRQELADSVDQLSLQEGTVDCVLADFLITWQDCISE